MFLPTGATPGCMQSVRTTSSVGRLTIVFLCGGLGACNTMDPPTTGSISAQRVSLVVSDAERDCLGRAMYFESRRDDAEGLLAVGTVVMNRLEAAMFPGGICAVVGQKGQFATGVLTKPMQDKDLEKVQRSLMPSSLASGTRRWARPCTSTRLGTTFTTATCTMWLPLGECLLREGQDQKRHRPRWDCIRISVCAAHLGLRASGALTPASGQHQRRQVRRRRLMNASTARPCGV